MTRWLLPLLLLAACTPEPPPIVEPHAVAVPFREPAPGVIDEAARVQTEAAHMAATRDDLSAPELLRMLELSHAMQRAVRDVRSHRTPANVAAVRGAIRALREFTNRNAP